MASRTKPSADFPIDEAVARLERTVPDLDTPIVDLIAVQTRDPFKVLTATILSARTKDEVTAQAAARLFAKAETPDQLAGLSAAELEKLIFPVGFFRNKAEHLRKLPEALKRFGGRVPSEIEDLVTLPGVGRKTANLVRSVAFGLPAICVDTHVHRITNIWGYVETDTPLATEKALREKLPEQYWIRINGLLVAFGQSICRPVAPHCDACPLADLCPKLGVTPRRPPKKGKAGKTDAQNEAGEADAANAANAADPGRLFLSWNVNGLRAALGKGFLDFVQNSDADILALQETKLQLAQIPPEIAGLPGYHACWSSAEKKGYSGVAVFSRNEPLQVTEGLGVADFDREGRVLTLEFPDFFFVNAYFPNAQDGLKRLDYKLAFDEAMQEHMKRLAARKTVLLCGDFNVAHQEIDLARPRENRGNPGFSDEERAWMDRFLGAGFVDSFRLFCPDPGHYSWWSYRSNARAKNIGWRIDYFVCDAKSRGRVLEAGILPEIMGSDHCPVSIRFR